MRHSDLPPDLISFKMVDVFIRCAHYEIYQTQCLYMQCPIRKQREKLIIGPGLYGNVIAAEKSEEKKVADVLLPWFEILIFEIVGELKILCMFCIIYLIKPP